MQLSTLAAAPASFARPTILLVDYAGAAATELTRNLTRLGYDATHVTSLGDALLHSARWLPDLVLLEVCLPSGQDRTAFEELKAGLLGPILVVSNETRVSRIVDCLEAGAVGYVVKPCSVPVLGAQIRASLRRLRSTLSAGDSSLACG